MKYFFWKGLKFDVSNPEVYPPKPGSLFLAKKAVEVIPRNSNVLEIGTGSGAIAIAVAKFVKGACVIASDINSVAAKVAKHNAKINRIKISTVTSDLFRSLPKKKFDVIIVHPPAIPYLKGKTWGMSRGMTVATNGGFDGSKLVVKSIVQSAEHLNQNGFLLLLLPNWSNTGNAYRALSKNFSSIENLGNKIVRFFPEFEGKPTKEMMRHVKKLVKKGIIELWTKEKKLFSRVSVIKATS